MSSLILYLIIAGVIALFNRLANQKPNRPTSRPLPAPRSVPRPLAKPTPTPATVVEGSTGGYPAVGLGAVGSVKEGQSPSSEGISLEGSPAGLTQSTKGPERIQPKPAVLVASELLPLRPGELQRAFVLTQILGPPRSRQPYRPPWQRELP